MARGSSTKKATQTKNINMQQNVERFNESQLKRSGFAEAITPELKAKMRDGLPVIEHLFGKYYDGDKVDAVLHLKKSASSDFYFLNRFELQLQKEGLADIIKQVFYIHRKNDTQVEKNQTQKQPLNENRYTLKEAYNLLSGRPVFKQLLDKDGQEYTAWVKLNFKNKLENGNYEMKQYHNNYGFDLNNTLSKYPIKDLVNPQSRDSLIESLQRGNLQRATFTGRDGVDEKLYISPNIILGALNVYDGNKQRFSTEQLLEKEYIGKELASELSRRIQQQQKPEENKQTEKLEDDRQKKQTRGRRIR